jgi:hypothetical protein
MTAKVYTARWRIRFAVELKQAERHLLTRSSVNRNAPEQSGVYGLLNPDRWIYIGHAANIRTALLNYLSGQMPSALQWQPRYFTFETLPYKERIVRHRELVAQNQPVCNRKTQSPFIISG